MIGLFNLIYSGSAHEALPVPHYSGALFAPGQADSEDPIARALALLEGSTNAISDRQVLNLLRLLTRTRLRVRQGRKNTWVDGPVDFSALSSEYIGILYEGLLDFELKQAAPDDPVIFLGVGKQPALTLSQLEAMDDKTIKQLFEALKKLDTVSTDEGDDEAGEAEAEAEEATLEADPGEELDADDSNETEDVPEEPPAEEAEAPALSADHLERAQAWLKKAAVLAGLVKKRRGRRAPGNDDQEALTKAAKLLCARLVAPGQFYLVRWGGTRKGAGTFYTRPQLAGPTISRTLQPLVFDVVRTANNARTGLDEATEWIPKTPAAILALKVCDTAMGSGTFLVGTLRYLTEALVQSLYYHKLIERADDGGVPRMADGQIAALLSDELLKLNPAHEGFEDALRAQLKRHIVERCLYGVDIDPLAGELGRMALWVETMDRDLPFGFLDHKLKVGNALVGAWFDSYRDYPAMAWEREGGDKDYQKNNPGNLINHFYLDAKGKKRGDKFTAAILARAKKIPNQLIASLSGQLRLEPPLIASDVHDELLDVFNQLHGLPVHESDKRAALYRDKVLNNPKYHALKARMDLWCALWFWPGDELDIAPLPDDFAQPQARALTLAGNMAQAHRFFHWELEFPDVFTPQRRGFDALLGNPPWEIQKPNSKEFFSNHDPLYRAYGKQEALAKQLDYFRDRPTLEHNWIVYKAGLKGMSNWTKAVGQPFGDRVTVGPNGNHRHDLNLGTGRNSFPSSAEMHRKWRQLRSQRPGYADVSHPFRHQGSADLNTYKMFLELSHALLAAQGRLGMIVPSGIYTDKGTTSLRELFLDHCDWQWLFGFENRDKVFDIDSRFKFCALIVQKGGKTGAIRAAFMHRNVDDWGQAERFALAYPRERVLEFSPFSKAILEIRSEQDLRVLQKIYAHGVLLGDQSERGWGIKYATEFHMTNDSKLFPPRPKWEEQGYRPDEYGHWLKGPWRDYRGPSNILDREPELVLSRDGTQALRAAAIEDVALPLYEGRMIGQFDFSEKGWVSGKGRTAVWRDIPFGVKVIEPQYLMGLMAYRGDPEKESKSLLGLKTGFLAIGSATNSRSMFAGLMANVPAGNSVAILQSATHQKTIALMTALNSFAYDFTLRNRLGGLNLNYFVVAETPIPALNEKELLELSRIGIQLCLPNNTFALEWHQLQSSKQNWQQLFALTDYERQRLKSISEAICSFSFGLNVKDFGDILESCDLPRGDASGEKAKRLNPKGFWRIDKDKDPELRHTILSLIAFHDLQEKGLDAFLTQNNGEGWMIPDTLRLADYGLGHDDRAQEHQPVASRLGPRFYDWQLNEDVERSWQECAAHAELIRRIVPLPAAGETSSADQTPGALGVLS